MRKSKSRNGRVAKSWWNKVVPIKKLLGCIRGQANFKLMKVSVVSRSWAEVHLQSHLQICLSRCCMRLLWTDKNVSLDFKDDCLSSHGNARHELNNYGSPFSGLPSPRRSRETKRKWWWILDCSSSSSFICRVNNNKRYWQYSKSGEETSKRNHQAYNGGHPR